MHDVWLLKSSYMESESQSMALGYNFQHILYYAIQIYRSFVDLGITCVITNVESGDHCLIYQYIYNHVECDARQDAVFICMVDVERNGVADDDTVVCQECLPKEIHHYFQSSVSYSVAIRCAFSSANTQLDTWWATTRFVEFTPPTLDFFLGQAFLLVPMDVECSQVLFNCKQRTAGLLLVLYWVLSLPVVLQLNIAAKFLH